MNRTPPNTWHLFLHTEWSNWMTNFKDTPPWKSINPPTSKLPRHPDKLRKVIDELDVEHAPRYAPQGTSTFCNIFVSDVLTALGLQPGHWCDTDGNPAKDGQDGAFEMNANRMARWFKLHGPRNGWEEADRLTASDAAGRGHTVVVVWDSKLVGTPGHIAIMLPEGTIAQAGRKNFVGGTIREGFGKLTPKFYVHVPSGPHSAAP